MLDSALIVHDAKALTTKAEGADEIPFGLGFAALPDLGLSLIGDTLTLPVTVFAFVARRFGEAQQITEPAMVEPDPGVRIGHAH